MTPRLPRPSRAEEIALFRHAILGDLLARDLEHGELQDELKARADRRYRPPGARASRSFHWKTLQSWYYQAKKGVDALKPACRARGVALALDDRQRELLLDIRREHRSVATEIILAEVVRNGAVPKGAISEATLRRLYRSHDLGRESVNRGSRRERRRWQADRPCRIWHADVCHVWLRDAGGKPRKAYVHGILDDHSRYVLALEARDAEREMDLLSVLCHALLRFPSPDLFYVDNGSCYRGDLLQLALERLGIRLIHAKPYDPQARGKMERFWRTLRTRCTDHLAPTATLHDLNAALLAFLDADYLCRPHAGILGQKPLHVFQAGIVGLPSPRTAADLARALELTVNASVRGDCTVSIEGRTFEIAGRHLVGKRIDVIIDPFTHVPLRATYKGAGVPIGRCDPVANGHRARAADAAPAVPAAPFDPIARLLAAARQGGDA